MNFKEYKIKRGAYNGIEDSTVTIPSDIVYLTGGSHNAAHGLHEGHLHFIGIVKGDYVINNTKGLALSVHKFNSEYCFITLADIKFVSDAPETINPDTLSESEYAEKLAEWNNQIDFNKYYITFYTKSFNLIRMAKIQQIKSEFEINICEVYRCNEYREDFEVRSIEFCNVDLSYLCLDGYKRTIISKVVEGEIAEKYWNTLIYNVLKPLNLDFIDTTKLNILPDGLASMDKAHKVANDFIHSNKPFNDKELEDLLDMKRI